MDHIGEPSSGIIPGSPGGNGVPGSGAAGGSGSGSASTISSGGSKPISGFSKLKKRLETLSGISDWRFHDFRRGMVTYLEENGLDRVYSERILNHKDRSVTGIYARPEHREHLRRVYEQWSLVLSGSDGLDAQNVIMFSR